MTTHATVECPHCRGQFPLTETLARPLVEAERAAQAANQQRLLADLKQQQDQLAERNRLLDVAEKALEQRIATKVQVQVASARTEMAREAAAHVEVELQQLRESAAEKDEALKKARDAEIELRRQQRALIAKQEELELSVQRQLDAERQCIRSEAKQAADEAHRLKLAEKDQVIEAVKKQLDEARRASEKTSQQLQGDVQEADLALILTRAFPRDEILRTQKGQNGADVVQRVLGDRGQECGTILWESKRTKNWSDAWLSKLRDDQRAEGADLAVLVSAVLPDGIRHFAEREGVWIASPQFTEHLASALRQQITQVADARVAMTGQHEKANLLYAYLTGPEFRQRLQGIAESFAEMQCDLDSEKRAFTQRWSKREKQIERMAQNALGLYGEVQGISGASMPELEAASLAIGARTATGKAAQLPAA